MQSESAYGPDWRDAAAYAPLLEAGRSLFAWEWLRRDPGYRAAADRALSAQRIAEAPSGPERFGLVAFEPPVLTVPHARPMWRSDVHPFVVSADRCASRAPGDQVDVNRMHNLARIILEDGADHLLLSDGLRSIRLDGSAGIFTSGLVCLRYSIEGLETAERPLLTLRRFLALSRTGRFSRSLHPREVRARRWIMMLRAHDAIVTGADQRQIAEQLFSKSVAEPHWRSRESSVRSQVQRLVRSAQRFAAGGYRVLLR